MRIEISASEKGLRAGFLIHHANKSSRSIKRETAISDHIADRCHTFMS